VALVLLLILGFVHFQWLFVLGFSRNLVCGTPFSSEQLATMEGRTDTDFPSPRCCVDEGCLKRDKGRYAVLTTLRSNEYLPLLKHLACSMRNTNPELNFLVATVKGDLSAQVEAEMKAISNVKVVYWDEFVFPNKRHRRFSLNWVKLRAWEMEDYDMLLMIDADMLVAGSLGSLFSLPFHFGTVLDQDKFEQKYSSMGRQQGGVVLLRPCKQVAQHMMDLVSSNKTLQFAEHHAEQSFLDWYFRYERWTLPIKYNAIAYQLRDRHGGPNVTTSGAQPVIVHYAGDKPFVLDLQHNPEQNVALGCT